MGKRVLHIASQMTLRVTLNWGLACIQTVSRRCLRRGLVRSVLLACACCTTGLSPLARQFAFYLITCQVLPGVLVLTAGSNGEGESFTHPLADAGACGPESSRGEAVLEWARKSGAKIHPGIAVASFESMLETRQGRQLVATQSIANESLLLRIPTSLHMSVKHLRRHAQARVYAFLDETDVVHSSLFGLAFLLLHEAQNISSFWRPYLCSLPSRPPSPFLLPSKELDKLLAQVLPRASRASLTSPSHTAPSFVGLL